MRCFDWCERMKSLVMAIVCLLEVRVSFLKLLPNQTSGGTRRAYLVNADVIYYSFFFLLSKKEIMVISFF